MGYFEDIDTPNTQPGWCPECGQRADIWEAVSQTWCCSLCDWRGRQPNLMPPNYERAA